LLITLLSHLYILSVSYQPIWWTWIGTSLRLPGHTCLPEIQAGSISPVPRLLGDQGHRTCPDRRCWLSSASMQHKCVIHAFQIMYPTNLQERQEGGGIYKKAGHRRHRGQLTSQPHSTRPWQYCRNAGRASAQSCSTYSRHVLLGLKLSVRRRGLYCGTSRMSTACRIGRILGCSTWRQHTQSKFN
jgi:hypothetical protein